MACGRHYHGDGDAPPRHDGDDDPRHDHHGGDGDDALFSCDLSSQ